MGAATRDAFGEALVRIGDDPRIVALSGDLKDSTRIEAFAEKYPDRYLECGIAEKNLIGVAAGLALSGKLPWAGSFSTFIAGRLEVVRVSVAYMEANVRIVGTHTGIGVGEDGYSQMAFEDVAAMRTLPNMAIVQPADAVETERAVEYLAEHVGPAFLRLTRQGVADVHEVGYSFQFGKIETLREGADLAIFASGGTVGPALEAAEALEGEGVSTRVLNVHTIKPLDTEAVLAAASECRALVSVEDHSVVGGLGGAIAETLAARSEHAPLKIIGHTTFGESGSPGELYEKYGLSGDRIAATTREFLGTLD